MPPQTKAVTILAVDDEAMNNQLVQRVFRPRTNFRILVASSGTEGLKILETEKVDIILVDQSMPKMSGVQFLEKALAIAPHAVNIMVTGYPELDDVVQARKKGLVRHIIAKPWRVDDLQSAVDRALALRDMKAAVDSL